MASHCPNSTTPFSFFIFLMLFSSFIITINAEKINSTGSFWASAKEEGEVDDSHLINDSQENELDGGFSSLEGMLQWAIGHSDPSKLKEAAQDNQRLSSEEVHKKQIELKELMGKLKMPSDAELMQIAIDDLNNESLSLEDRHRALQELLILVEPIDNAKDLNKLGGLKAVIRQLDHSDTNIRATSAWIIGKASQNNPIVQKQVLEIGALVKLMKLVQSNLTEEAIKALYAVSALIRNNVDGQELFCAEDGNMLLQDILSNSSIDIRLKKKSLFLVADLAESQLENTDKLQLPFLADQLFLKLVVDVLVATDLDLQEKALYSIKSLLLLKSTDALILKNFCKLDAALEKMRLQLELLMADENHREYAIDLESLRREVEENYFRKLDKVMQVPT
ncbi:hypothetical protein LIER_09835 [Lithospermum erythrorhizon]|uniref:Nucleotide exchange factor Fes1 domain-containing protein n=1 Tax=Lithospermum erythrorhizon TaxID=34254 RepID=A0AAV3PK55_LITER